jgi:hypothetical protein
MKTGVYLLSCGLVCAGISCRTADKKHPESTYSPRLAGIESDWEGENEAEDPVDVAVSVVEYLRAGGKTTRGEKQTRPSDQCTVTVRIEEGDTGPVVVSKILIKIATEDPCFGGLRIPHPNPHRENDRALFIGKMKRLRDIAIDGDILVPGVPKEIGDGIWVERVR